MQHKLKQLRAENKLSQEDVADMLGITRSSYSLRESSKYEFKQDEMFILSNYFGLPMEHIFLPRGHRNGDRSPVKVEGGDINEGELVCR